MKSSTGQHWVALDQVRALAAFMVFSWHFIHASTGYPVPFEGAPTLFPFVLLDEGHTGVALFMALSGYLFAKLLDGKAVNYAPFFWNRALRLLPLLLVVVVIVRAREYLTTGELDLARWIRTLLSGAVKPTLPNGGWSITVEAHFYLVLPLLMWTTARWRLAPLAFLAVAIAVRAGLYLYFGEIQGLAYWTIVGHIDQFLLGILAFQQREFLRRRHAWAAAVALAFMAFWYLFDRAGGFYQLDGAYPTHNPVWIVLPTVEAAAFSALIAYYDTSFRPANTGISGFIGRIGAYSYSIYLLHLFVVFEVADYIHTHIMNLSNLYVASLWSLVCFLAMYPVAWLSFRIIEGPFLKLRKPYVKAAAAPPAPLIQGPVGTPAALAPAPEVR